MLQRSRTRSWCCTTFTLLAMVGTALAVSPNIVISQVYGGGGNSGAPYRNDFVELFNRGDAAVTLTDWSIQYAAAAGSGWGGNKVTISATIEPGQYFLIQLAGGANGVPLPTPDLTPSGAFNMSATNGKLALVNSSTSLPAVNCPNDPGIVDLIGYGSADCFENAAAPAGSNATALLRGDGGCTDTDHNNLDFSVVAPTPRNSQSLFHVCSGGGSGACCVGTTCTNVNSQAECTALGGIFHLGVGCATDPCGAPTGACCNDTFCTVDTQQSCLDAGYVYFGNGTTCTPNPCVSCSSIANAKAGGAGVNVKLCEIVIANKTDLVSDPNTKCFHAQETIAGVTRGITVFGSNAAIDAVLTNPVKNVGDKINIYGLTNEYNGLFELTAPTTATKTGTPGVPVPLSVTPADFATGSVTAEGLESCLVLANCVLFTPPPANGATFVADVDYYAMDTTGATMVVHCTGTTALVGTAIPNGWLNIRGVFSQFDSAAPYDGGYQLLPRDTSDFTVGVGCGTVTGSCCISGACQGGYTQSTCAAAGGTYNGDASSCIPNPCTCEGVAAAKAAGPGQLVRICEATLSNDIDLISSATYKSIQLQDATGGITVFATNAEIDYILGHAFLYDKITVRGSTSEYYGLFELDTPVLESNDGPGTVPTPTIISTADLQPGAPAAEVLESAWVTLTCVTFAEAGGTFAAGTNYTATDANGTVVVRVATNALDMIGQTIPSGTVDITGIVSQYDTTDPFDGDYELMLTSLNDPTRLGQIELTPGCGPTVGACCVSGDCTPGTDLAGCTALGGDYLGDGSACNTDVCPTPVIGGDAALGLSLGSPSLSTEHIRNSIKVGAWPSRAYLQSMEFDNTGVRHAACGNLLALDFGQGGGTPGSAPSCNDPNRLGEAGKIYNLATDGTNRSQKIYDFNTLAGGVACTRTSGLSVSPANTYLAVWGTDTSNFYVLAYNPGLQPGTGTGVPFITTAWTNTAAISPAGGSQGTAWYDPNTILVYNTDYIPGFTTLNRVRFNGSTFTLLGSLTIPVTNSGGSMFTDVEFNPDVSPYVFCLFSNNDSTTGSSTYLSAINPTNWSIKKTVDISPVVDTGREIALGPDHYLYISQYRGYIDRINVDDPNSWTTASVVDYYHLSTFATYCGLDVAFDCPSASGACCLDFVCAIRTETQCAGLGGTFHGAGTTCMPDPCVCRGDCNCDGLINFDDINPFVSVLAGGTPCNFDNCDVNADGDINFDDINPFVGVLSGTGGCP